MRILMTLVLLAAGTLAPALAQEPARTGSIAGTVTIDGKPAPGIAVLVTADSDNTDAKVVARATSDREGKYKLDELAAGNYSLLPDAPSFVVAGRTRSWSPGLAVTLGEGEAVTGVALVLERGGVITGRVVDANGNPVIGEEVHLAMIDTSGKRVPAYSRYSDRATDDRGVYRVFGLVPNRYVVSVGDPADGSRTEYGSARKRYPETFYPGVADEGSATPVEVTAGGEASGIDISLGRVSETYSATGRIVDETGAPLARVTCGYGPVSEGRLSGGIGFGSVTNEQGEFRFSGLTPGSYAAIAMPDGKNTRSGSPAMFEVADRDVAGIVITLKKGVTVSGTVVVEGPAASDPASATSKISAVVSPVAPATGRSIESMFSSKSSRIEDNGTFTIKGVLPGTYKIGIFGYRQQSGVTLVRVERNGVTVPNEIELTADTDETGIVLVVSSGTGAIRGHVTVTNGTLGFERVYVQCNRPGAGETYRRIPIDDRGQFLVTGLGAGEYVVSVSGVTGERAGSWTRHRGKEQTVSVSDGATVDVALTLDLQNDPTEKP